MKPQVVYCVLVICAAVVPTSALAQTVAWCYAGHSDVIYCDDFDRYCNASPYPPYPCAPGTTSMGQFRQTGWTFLYDGCTEAWLQNDWFDEWPFNGSNSSPNSVRFPCQVDSKVGSDQRILTTDIQRRWGSDVFYFLATEEHPLHFEFTYYGQTYLPRVQAANIYAELAVDSDFPMTNHIWGPVSPNPTYGPKAYPILCAQGTGEPAGCPPISEAPVRASLAVGVVSFLDRDYMNETSWNPDQTPKVRHLCFYDGRVWWELVEGLFPGEGSFTLYQREHYIKLTIYPTYVRVEMTAVEPAPDEHSWCDIPRQYQGEFNTMRMGFAKHCPITAATGWLACQGNFRCPNGSFGAGAPAFDNLLLYGGDPLQTPYIITPPQPQTVRIGATGTFTVQAGGTPPLTYKWQKNRVDLSEGGHYSGVTTPTLTVSNASVADATIYRCMVTNTFGSTASADAALTLVSAPGDFDLDNDVDLTDFSHFQYCFAGPNRPPAWSGCDDTDLDNDNDCDLTDFGRFQACFNGPNRIPSCS